MDSATKHENSFIIFTDLDGTLLDPLDYSYTVAKPLVTRLRKKGIPIIFCSSKTRAEQEVYRRKLGISDPFIVEDGAAIFIKQGYFCFSYEYQRVVGDYNVIEFGIPYSGVRKKLREINEKYGLDIRGFGDMNAAAIAELTNLDIESAKLAKKREYEETLTLEGDSPQARFILSKIEEAGLKWSRGGRFYSVSSKSDKGKAAKIVIELFRRKLDRVKSIGIGDSLNDVPMLSVVNLPFLVQKPGNCWEEMEVKNLYRVSGVGPHGWVLALQKLLNYK